MTTIKDLFYAALGDQCESDVVQDLITELEKREVELKERSGDAL